MTPLRDIPDEAVVMYDSQNIESALEYLGLSHLKDEVTAIASIASDGDYSAIWFCESSNPYYLGAHYYPLPEYIDELPARVCKAIVLSYEYWKADNPLYR